MHEMPACVESSKHCLWLPHFCGGLEWVIQIILSYYIRVFQNDTGGSSLGQRIRCIWVWSRFLHAMLTATWSHRSQHHGSPRFRFYSHPSSSGGSAWVVISGITGSGVWYVHVLGGHPCTKTNVLASIWADLFSPSGVHGIDVLGTLLQLERDWFCLWGLGIALYFLIWHHWGCCGIIDLPMAFQSYCWG